MPRTVFICECECKCGICEDEDCDCECHDIKATTNHLKEFCICKKLAPRSAQLNRNQLFGLFAATSDPEYTLNAAKRFAKALSAAESAQKRSRSVIKKKASKCTDDV